MAVEDLSPSCPQTVAVSEEVEKKPSTPPSVSFRYVNGVTYKKHTENHNAHVMNYSNKCAFYAGGAGERGGYKILEKSSPHQHQETVCYRGVQHGK